MNAQLYTLSLNEKRSYLFVLAFVIGNVVLPQICHLIPQGGLIFLPIYFFTLVGAYKYGWQVGLMTAVASPIINSLCFGMPSHAMVTVILVKSVILALAAGMMAHYTKRVTMLSLLGVVLTYQILGGMVEWGMSGTILAPLQDFRLGMPGLIFQVLGGYLVIKQIK